MARKPRKTPQQVALEASLDAIKRLSASVSAAALRGSRRGVCLVYTNYDTTCPLCERPVAAHTTHTCTVSD